MEKKARRTAEQIREALEAKKASHYMHINKIDAQIAKLDAPKPPRKPREHKETLKSVLESAKNDLTIEEMRKVVEDAKRRKMEMGAI